MALKVALVQAATATGTPTYTQDFTDSGAGFSSDVEAAIIIAGEGTANHTSDGDEWFSFGIAAGANQAVVTRMHPDASAIGTVGGRYDQGWCFSEVAAAGGSDGEAAVNSFLSNGIRLDWLDQPQAQRLTSVLLIGGDVEAAVSHGVFATGSSGETVSVTHGLSATPELIVAITSFSTTTTGSVGLSMSIGFWDGTNFVNLSRITGNNGTNHRVVAQLVENAIGTRLQNAGSTTITNSLTLSNIGASAFDLTQTGSTPTLCRISFLCLRGTTTPISAKAGVYTLPTGTGNASMGMSMAAAPQALIMLPFAATATGSADGDPAEAWGACVSVLNGSTQYGGVATTTQNNVATSVAKSQSTNAQALRILDDAGAANVEATVNAWQATDVELNFSNIASAFVVPYLAFGIGGAPSISTAPSELSPSFNYTVTGTGFGTSQGASGNVYIAPTDSIADANKVTQTIVSWSDTSITFTATRGSLGYNTNMYLFVKEDGGTSNASGSVLQFKPGITLSWSA